MEIEILDVLISVPGLVVIGLAILTFMSCVFTLSERLPVFVRQSNNFFGSLGIFGFLFYVIVAFNLYPLYRNLRNNGYQATYSSLQISLDVAAGYAISFLFWVTVITFVGIFIAYFGYPIYSEVKKLALPLLESKPNLQLSLIILILFSPQIVFGLLLLFEHFNECQITVSLSRFLQMPLFGTANPPMLDPYLYFWYDLVPSCEGKILLRNTLIPSTTSISLSKAYNHFETLLLYYEVNMILSRVGSIVLTWLSPIADVLGIYAFFASLRKRRFAEK